MCWIGKVASDRAELRRAIALHGGAIGVKPFDPPGWIDALISWMEGMTSVPNLDSKVHRWLNPKLEPWRDITGVLYSGPAATDDALRLISDLDSLTQLDLQNTRITAAGLAHIHGLHRLRILRLGGVPVDDEGLCHLAELRDLEALSIDEGGKITDDGLRSLQGLRELKVLGINSSNIRGDGLRFLRGCTQLEVLVLDGTPITDAGMKHIGELQSIQDLSLSGTKVTDAGVRHLANLTQLRVLSLAETRLTDDGLKHLGQFQRLHEMDLRKTQIAGPGLRYLAGLKRLNRLLLSGTKINDEALEALPRVPNLYVDVSGTKVTAAAVVEFRKDVPEVEIYSGTSGQAGP